MVELGGKIAVVTGGGTGIGRGIASALIQEGVDVVVTGRRQEPLEDFVAEALKAGGQAFAAPGDVSIPEDAQRIIQQTVNQYGGVDFLINNAGVGGGSSIHNHDVDLWRKILSINLDGPFLMSRYTLPVMRNAESGHIINISSESGLEYYPGSGAYGVSKHALNALSEYIQRENQDLNIRVDTICPGMVVTEMTNDRPGLDHGKCLYPEDIADLVLFLLTRRPNIKIGTPILIQTMLNPWE